MAELPKPVVRVTKTLESLNRLLTRIHEGHEKKPDWIHLQANCRLDLISGLALAEILTRMHSCVRRGFRANNVEIRNKKQRLKYWRTVARHGFHDFTDSGWTKCHDSPFVANYDYIGDFLRGGLDALDPYPVYSAVLGTHDYSVEDFLHTKLCAGVDTILEPMAGTAEFSYHGHFLYPGFRYLMFDLDEDAKRHVEGLPWLEETDRQYVIADVLEDEIWERAKSFTATKSLSYIGKQSHHLFDAKQLYRLMDVATRHVDYFMLETPQVSLVSDMAEIDELTRPEMEDAGFEVDLVEEENGAPNPFTNLMAFCLEASTDREKRTLFRYENWTNWSQPTLFALASLLDLRVLYYHSDLQEFVPVEDTESFDESDCHENVTFMVFTRHPAD